MSPSFLTRSVSKCSLRSFSRATGTISLSVKSRAVSWMRRCSSVSSKSINFRPPVVRAGPYRARAAGDAVSRVRGRAQLLEHFPSYDTGNPQEVFAEARAAGAGSPALAQELQVLHRLLVA